MNLLRNPRFWASAGAFLLVAAAAGAVLFFRAPGEPLTEASLRAAEARWRERGPRDYDLEVVVGGVQRGDHAIAVRGGKVVRMTTDGAPVPESAWTYWTVEGMFRFLAEELDHARDPRSGYGADDAAQVLLRADFDPDLGLPRRFLRHVTGRSVDIHWTAKLSASNGQFPKSQ